MMKRQMYGRVRLDLLRKRVLLALDETDDEILTAWFQYPLQGTPPVVVHLARAAGGSAVSVRVAGGIDTVLEARIDTMLSLL
jgi:hypothetical protein